MPQFRRAVRAAQGLPAARRHGHQVDGAELRQEQSPGSRPTCSWSAREREKEYIVGDFGYDPERGRSHRAVPVRHAARRTTSRSSRPAADHADLAGLAAGPGRSTPTPSTTERWTDLLHDPRLRQLAEEHGPGGRVLPAPEHAAVHRHRSPDVPARVISQGEVDVQHLLKESALLVTDYSSVGFDFSFLHKPVLYYQFDRQRFLGRRGSHLDLDARAARARSCFDRRRGCWPSWSAAADAASPCRTEYVRRADRFLTHRDRHNCERIFEAVPATRPAARVAAERVAAHELCRRRACGRSAAAGCYFPAMRRMFALLPAAAGRREPGRVRERRRQAVRRQPALHLRGAGPPRHAR